LLTDTLQQIQQVNEGLVKEVLAVQAELESLKAEEKEAAAPPLKARGVPPLVPLSEVPEREAP
jgi:hypothetical protein